MDKRRDQAEQQAVPPEWVRLRANWSGASAEEWADAFHSILPPGAPHPPDAEVAETWELWLEAEPGDAVGASHYMRKCPLLLVSDQAVMSAWMAEEERCRDDCGPARWLDCAINTAPAWLLRRLPPCEVRSSWYTLPPGGEERMSVLAQCPGLFSLAISPDEINAEWSRQPRDRRLDHLVGLRRDLQLFADPGEVEVLWRAGGSQPIAWLRLAEALRPAIDAGTAVDWLCHALPRTQFESAMARHALLVACPDFMSARAWAELYAQHDSQWIPIPARVALDPEAAAKVIKAAGPDDRNRVIAEIGKARKEAK